MKEGAELLLYLSAIRLCSQRPTFAGEILVGTRRKLNMDTHKPLLYISTGEVVAKKEKVIGSRVHNIRPTMSQHLGKKKMLEYLTRILNS